MNKEKKSRSPKFRQAMNSIYAFLDYVFRIVMLNLLIVVPALLPFLIYSILTDFNVNIPSWVEYLTLIPAGVYLFPAIVATADVCKSYEEKATKGVFKEYFSALGKNYLRSLIISIFLYVIIFFLTFEITVDGKTFEGILLYFFNNMNNPTCLFGLALTLSFILMGLFILSHLPLVFVYFDGISLWQQLKLSFIMAFRKIGKTILVTLIIVGFIVLYILFGTFVQVVIFICGISLPIYLIVKLTFREYIKIYRKVEKKENEENV